MIFERWKTLDRGGSDIADVVPVFARDVEDGRVNRFIVRKVLQGYHAANSQSFVGVRNGHITMKNVEVPDSDRLVNINGFGDVARIFDIHLVPTRCLTLQSRYHFAGSSVAALNTLKTVNN